MHIFNASPPKRKRKKKVLTDLEKFVLATLMMWLINLRSILALSFALRETEKKRRLFFVIFVFLLKTAVASHGVQPFHKFASSLFVEFLFQLAG